MKCHKIKIAFNNFSQLTSLAYPPPEERFFVFFYFACFENAKYEVGLLTNLITL